MPEIPDYTEGNKAFEEWWVNSKYSSRYAGGPMYDETKELAREAYSLAFDHIKSMVEDFAKFAREANQND